jgi:hypothetical protein
MSGVQPGGLQRAVAVGAQMLVDQPPVLVDGRFLSFRRSAMGLVAVGQGASAQLVVVRWSVEHEDLSPEIRIDVVGA